KVPQQPCAECGGRGRKATTRVLDVDVPAGIADDQRIRVTGRGHAGEHGGPPGDLYVLVRVAEDERFMREGDDLITPIDLAAPLAALGTSVTVPTLDGEEEVEIPAGTQPGTVITLRRRGLPSLPEGSASVGGVRVEVRGEEVPDDWAERWKRFHVPILLGGRLYVRPPWEQPAVRPGVHEVVIDPGQAFGTGTHPTTRLCLELMLGLDPAEGSFADLGCGSGVLAIAAAKLGFGPVSAFDADRAAVAATDFNARAKADLLERVERLDLRTGPVPEA